MSLAGEASVGKNTEKTSTILTVNSILLPTPSPTILPIFVLHTTAYRTKVLNIIFVQHLADGGVDGLV